MSSKAPPTTPIVTPATQPVSEAPPSVVAKTKAQPQPNLIPTNTQPQRALLLKSTQLDESQIRIPKDRVNEFKLGDTIKIEGPSTADRGEFRAVTGIAPTGVLMIDSPLELKHKKGATVRVARLDPAKNKKIKVQARLLDGVMPEEGEMESKEIRIEKDCINDFSSGDCVKIEGTSVTDPCEFRTISSTTPFGGIFLDKAFECKHEGGAIVKVILSKKDALSPDTIRKTVKAELDYVLTKKLKDKDGNYGIRFFPGETRTSHEVTLAVTIDIAQLLKIFPSVHVKIIGYSGAPSTDGDYKTNEDVKYLALKRCQVIKELLQSHGVKNQIGIEAGLSLRISACCLIEFIGPDKEQYIQDINEAADRLIAEKEHLDTSIRFEINATGQIGGRYLARIDVDMCAMNGMRFKQGDRRENQVDMDLKLSKENRDANAPQVHDYSAVLSTIEETTGLNQPYLPNEEVEYFSRTNGRWLNAFVKKVTYDEQVEDQWLYDLVFPRSKGMRTKADMGSLRKPLGQDGVKTKVEVYTKRNNGSWLPGYIEGYQPFASTVGYQVMVRIESSTGEQLLKNIPLERIRRRFEAGTEIEFFVDSKFGWRRATISPEAKDGCTSQFGRGVKEIQWRHAELSKQLQVATSTPSHWPTVEESCDKHSQPSLEATQMTPDSELNLEPWTLVPIKIKDSVAAEIFAHMQKVGFKQYELQTSLQVELYRVRSPSVTSATKPDCIFKSLVVSL